MPEQRHELTFEEITGLVTKFLACPTFSTPSGRAVALNMLPDDLKTAINYAPLASARQEIVNIVQACLNFSNGLEKLLKVVRFYDAGTNQLADLEQYLQEINLPVPKPNGNTTGTRPQSYIPFEDNPLFQERPGEFETIEKLLAAGNDPARLGLVGVTGLGGIGKTQLAAKLCHRFQQQQQQKFPDGIFWMTATGDLRDWQRQLAELAVRTGYLPPDDDTNLVENEMRRAQHMGRYLAEHAEALLVLDNVEDTSLVTKALPTLVGKTAHCAILYTSRLVIAPAGAQVHRVDRLPEEAALRLLLESTRPNLLPLALNGNADPEAEAARALCQAVGYLPLALTHLRAVLARSGTTSLVRLLTIIKERGAKAVEQGDQYEKALFAAFEETWRLVRTAEAREIFLLAACFPEVTPIPLWLLGLAAGLGESGDLLEPLGDARYELHDLSLLEDLSGEQVRMHPMVREFGLGCLAMEAEGGQAIRQAAIERLAGAFCDLGDLEKRAWRVGYWQLLAQVQAVLDYGQALDPKSQQLAAIKQWKRRLDLESHLLGASGIWPSELPNLFYQQLYNRQVEENHQLATSSGQRAAWLQLQEPVGAEDRALLRIFLGHSNTVWSVAFSPDGRFILSGSDDETVRLWEANTGLAVRSFDDYNDRVRSVAFSPDGRFILFGSFDGTVALWGTESGQVIRSFKSHSEWVRSVAFSPDGSLILSGFNDGTVMLWETESGREVRFFVDHRSSVINSMTFSPDGRFILSGFKDGTVVLWETESGKEVRFFVGHARGVRSVAFSPDGHYILSGSDDGTIKLWETKSGKEVRSFVGHRDCVWSVAFSPDGRFILSGSADRTVRLWEVDSGRMVRSFVGHALGVRSVAFSPKGHYILSGSDDGRIRMWEADIIQTVHSFSFGGHSKVVKSVAFSPDGRYILSGSGDKTVVLWEADSGKVVRSFVGHRDWVMSMAFSPDSRLVVSGSDDKTVKLWEADSGKVRYSFMGHHAWVRSVAFSPDGRLVVSGSDDKTVRLWDIVKGLAVRSFVGHRGTVRSVAFSADSRLVLSGSDDGTVRLWEAESGLEVRSFQGHSSNVYSVAFSADDRMVVSGSADGTVRLWEADSGLEVGTFKGHSSTVWNVAFSPDDRFIISGDESGQTRLWQAGEPDTGRCLALYQVSYGIEAIHWVGSEEVWLADNGGPRNHPNIYRLKLENFPEG
jgi:WD40 repeat protein